MSVSVDRKTELLLNIEFLSVENGQLKEENQKLRALLNDKEYIKMKADYNKGHLSWANMINARERGLNLV